jgi:hypothetical protein
MKKFKVEYLTEYIVETILEQNNLFNSGDNDTHNFSELKRRLRVEVNARLAMIPSGTTFDESVNAIINQIPINNIINNNKQK